MAEMVVECIGHPEFQVRLDAIPRRGDHVFVGGGRFEVCQVQHRLDERPVVRIICGGNITNQETPDG